MDQSLIRQFEKDYLDNNSAANNLSRWLSLCGVGIRPLIDHAAIRTLNVNAWGSELESIGYTYDAEIGVLEFEDWWAKVYRKPGHTTLFVDQPYDGPRGENSIIKRWVDFHGDQQFHHIAILVDDIEYAVGILAANGVRIAGEIIGDPNSDLRQVFTKPETKNDEPFTVLELIERHNGYKGFLPPQADGLMESTRKNGQ